MSIDEVFYAQFIEELAALDGFLTTRAAQADGGAGGQRERVLALSRHDPDVRRLLEGMAYLSARTRVLAVTGLRSAVHRLNRGYFDAMVSPMPAMAMIQAVAAAGLTAAAALPRRTDVRLTTPTGTIGLFSTTRPLTVLPLSLLKARVSTRGRGYRLVLQIQTVGSYRQRGPIDPLAFHFEEAGDYTGAREQMRQISACFAGASVIFDPPDGAAPGSLPAVPCEVTFGAPQVPDPREENTTEHPLARVRSFFHFPSQELFLDVRVPGADSPWQKASICIDLDENWPVSLSINEDDLKLFVVPVTNLRSAHARPVRCDGTREAYPIQDDSPLAPGSAALRPGEASSLHEVRGVYELTDRGPVPLRSGLLTDAGDVYEIETTGDDPDDLQHRLLLKIPGAFEDPRTILVDARWYQPGFDAEASGRLTVTLPTRRLEHVALRLADDPVPHRTSPLWNDPPKLLHIMSLRTKVRLGRDDLMDLMALLGAGPGSRHAAVVGLVAEVVSSEEPDVGLRAAGVRYVYELRMRPYDDSLQGLVDDFRAQVHALLDAWLPGAVEVRAVPALGGPSAPPPSLRPPRPAAPPRRRAALVSAALWKAILSTLDGIEGLVEAALPAAGADAGPDALASLSREAGARMDALCATLAAPAGADAAQAMTQTLVLYLDEHVMAQLTVADWLSFPLLQERALPAEDGGDVFYDCLDRLLRPPATPSMLHEVYAYCLDAGFRGRYDDDASIARYRSALAAVLAPAQPAGAKPAEAAPRLPGSARPPALYYAATALLVALICVAPMLLSNL